MAWEVQCHHPRTGMGESPKSFEKVKKGVDKLRKVWYHKDTVKIKTQRKVKGECNDEERNV